ncbi:hypothetical protein evm_004594 [Chilo suppressalis]|nr:hypothetical protein evm_004594 [Chilo suppressalis]
MKATVFVLLVLIVGVCVANQCGSCGSECAAACGTRRFRTCCFNYLRKKRGHEGLEFLVPATKTQEQDRNSAWLSKLFSDASASEYQPYSYEDTIENRLLNTYE